MRSIFSSHSSYIDGKPLLTDTGLHHGVHWLQRIGSSGPAAISATAVATTQTPARGLLHLMALFSKGAVTANNYDVTRVPPQRCDSYVVGCGFSS